jgi:hypothetical protein
MWDERTLAQSDQTFDGSFAPWDRPESVGTPLPACGRSGPWGLLPDAAVSPTEAAQKLCLQEMGEPIRFITELTVHN